MKVNVPPIKSQGIKTKLVPWIYGIIPKEFDGTWIEPLTEQTDHKKAKSYWTALKSRLRKEDSQPVTNCDQLKMRAWGVNTKERLLFMKIKL